MGSGWVAFHRFPKSTQEVHGIVQSPFLFDIVFGLLKQFPLTLGKRILCLSDLLGKLRGVHFKNGGSVEVQPIRAF